MGFTQYGGLVVCRGLFRKVAMERKNFSAEYFEKALAKAYGCEKLSVENCKIEVVNQSGENFCSVIYRVALQFRRSPEDVLESGKYILKDLLPSVAELGTNEKQMFEEFLPEMTKILNKCSSELGERKLYAECFLTETTAGKEIYLLEDLGDLGYTSLDRFQGICLEDAKVCLRKMAQFHGASMVLCQEQPEFLDKLSPSDYAKGLSDNFAKALVLDGAEFAANFFADELPEIARKMNAQIPDTYARRIQDIVNPKNSKFNAIVHGDVWVNNIMFNRPEEKAVLVDFQNCFWASPAIDLHYFFYTSLRIEVLLHRKDELLKYYFENLTKTLTHCDFIGAIPTFNDLKLEMERCLFYGYYAVCCELPICCASPEASTDFNLLHLMGYPEKMLAKRHELFKSERVRETVKTSLLEFEQRGLLETP
ncbi:uncharacterized protein Dana_GF23615 [Drosophila ananassae]|uniref:CHK kinase-like domain-containing protein n=1 Tax=Drosophila ananassae TaxID=7217 RepID=B3M8R0_DROAN|nr:uncharacterized protein LOC6506256 [Drosophila ananassae]EDV41061.2 uncharacterized protein Dana_GF23615 [Drosophila ananassae]